MTVFVLHFNVPSRIIVDTIPTRWLSPLIVVFDSALNGLGSCRPVPGNTASLSAGNEVCLCYRFLVPRNTSVVRIGNCGPVLATRCPGKRTSRVRRIVASVPPPGPISPLDLDFARDRASPQ